MIYSKAIVKTMHIKKILNADFQSLYCWLGVIFGSPGGTLDFSCIVSLHGPGCSQDSLVHSSPPVFFSDWWSVAEDPTEDSKALRNGRAQKRKRPGPWFTALMRTAPWPGTLVETLYKWKRNFCCVCLLVISLSDYYTFHYSPSSLENFFWSLRDNSESCGPWASTLVSPSFLGVLACTTGLLRTNCWFYRWSFPWSPNSLSGSCCCLFSAYLKVENGFPQATRAFAPALDI